MSNCPGFSMLTFNCGRKCIRTWLAYIAFKYRFHFGTSIPIFLSLNKRVIIRSLIGLNINRIRATKVSIVFGQVARVINAVKISIIWVNSAFHLHESSFLD